ncbi:zinc ABC transporter permease [Aureimonas endophytica]|uniref:Zinc ABC transporter permease n=1 Tax=Aureimonas endophytica TaxID=2027858 RepID=A0A916ZF80_9HYPH|nr:metal ABC transporter permease [Aureimonas endophytica]GGD92771.1 zinc ABC transporter permease [Aureimonas endophytica]
MSLHDLLLGPFVDYGFMRRALIACLALGLGAGPIGVLLVLRRMSLVGDALSHAVLPGAAVGFLVAGFSLPAMGLGGLVAGLAVAGLAGLASRATALREDASFAGFYLISLSLGVLIVSLRGSNVDLLHVLFGTILAIDSSALFLIGGIASFTMLTVALFYRPLLLQSLDPGFLRAVGVRDGLFHFLFLFLVVINLVAGFQTLGTLMAVGLMMLPASAAQLWTKRLPAMMATAAAIAFVSGYLGLVASFRLGLPSGPTILLFAGAIYCLSLVFAPSGALARNLPRRRHKAA